MFPRSKQIFLEIFIDPRKFLWKILSIMIFITLGVTSVACYKLQCLICISIIVHNGYTSVYRRDVAKIYKHEERGKAWRVAMN